MKHVKSSQEHQIDMEHLSHPKQNEPKSRQKAKKGQAKVRLIYLGSKGDGWLNGRFEGDGLSLFAGHHDKSI
jgi:hypothetical protein